MDLLDRICQKTRNKNSPDRMGLFKPQRRKAETLLLAWLSASLRLSELGKETCPLPGGSSQTELQTNHAAQDGIREQGTTLPSQNWQTSTSALQCGHVMIGSFMPKIPHAIGFRLGNAKPVLGTPNWISARGVLPARSCLETVLHYTIH